MHYEEFLKQLQTLRQITPSDSYKEKSLRLILASPQNDPIENNWRSLLIRVGLTGSVLTATLLVVFNSSVPMKVAGLDAHDLRAEAQVLEVNLALAEIKETAIESKQTNAALEESAKSDPGHLNATVLNREVKELETGDYHNESIDKALEEIAN